MHSSNRLPEPPSRLSLQIRVDDSEVPSFFFVFPGGGGRWDFTKEENGGKADEEGDDCEHEKES
ncbi:hypothetical protein ACSBR1_010820 [Camellia fascicularis]